MRVDNRKNLSSFVIEGAERSDEGLYNITVTNPAGEDKAEIIIRIVGERERERARKTEKGGREREKRERVLQFTFFYIIFSPHYISYSSLLSVFLFSDVPDPPENVRCTGVGEDTASVLWDPPKFDGGSLIKGKNKNAVT